MLLCPRRPGPSSGSLQGWGRAPTTARQRPAACCGHLPASHRRLEPLQASGNVLDSLLIEAVVKEILFKVTGIRAQLTLDLKPPGTLWGLTQGHVSLLVWVLVEFSLGPHSETGSTQAPPVSQQPPVCSLSLAGHQQQVLCWGGRAKEKLQPCPHQTDPT